MTVEQPRVYWRWQYRVLPALLTVPLAMFFTFAVVALVIEVGREGTQEGWSAELIVGATLGVVVLGVLSVGFIMWTIAAFRAGRISHSEGEVALPRLPLTPFAFFPCRVPLNRIVDIDFDEPAVRSNKPPVVTFSRKMAKPVRLKLARYPEPDTVHAYLKTHLGHLESPQEE